MNPSAFLEPLCLADKTFMLRKLIIILLLCFLGLSGCASLVRQVGTGRTIDLSEGEALIFGKIVFIENNEEKTPFSRWTRKPTPVFFQIESEKYIKGREVERDGSFYWVVPVGTYIIPEIEYAYAVIPQVAFEIPVGANAVYLGTLTIDVETGSLGLSRRVKKIKNITVENEFDNARETLLIRNPGFTSGIEEGLMVHDESIPVDWQLIERGLLRDIILTIFNPSFPLWQ